jgi:hypothetical protein
MNSITKKILKLRDSFEEMGNELRKEQKELLFHKKSKEEEAEYFNFLKFLFQSPDEGMEF